MKNIKCILLDIDKTLTNDNKEITEETSQIFSKINKDFLIVLVSGRNAKYTIEKSKKCCASPIIISDNGAVILNYEANEVLFKIAFNKELLDIIWHISLKYNIGVAFNTLNKRYWDSVSLKKRHKTDNDVGINDTSEIIDTVTQVVIHGNNESEFLKCLDEIKIINEIEIGNYGRESDGKCFADLNIKGTSKGRAIDELYKLFNIKKSESICFGDSKNDLSMFESSGVKVAMINGTEEIKDNADFITEFSNNENGVIEFLRQYLLN